MEKYAKKLKIRIVFMSIIALCATIGFICGAFGVFGGVGNEGYRDFFSGFQSGLFAVLIVGTVFKIVRYIRALKNTDICKKIFICENDERTMLINEKSGQRLFVCCGYVLITAAVVAGYFSRTVFFSLIGAYILMEIVFLSLKAYYRHTM